MLVGGCHMVFELGYWLSLSFNSVLIFIFLMVSMFREKKYQLLVAKALSILYAILMLVIMVLLVIEAIRLRNTCSISPSTFSLLLVVSAFLLAGLLHLKEFWKPGLLMLPGAITYLTIPSKYMLLPFYCVFNLNDVSWGTRETVDFSNEIEKKEKKETEENKSSFSSRVLQVVAENKKKNKEKSVAGDWKDAIINKRTNVIRQDSGKDKEIWKNVTDKLLPLEVSIEEKQKN